MYVTKAERERCKKVDVDIFLSNVNSQKLYRPRSAKSINIFIREICLDESNDEAYYINTKNEKSRIHYNPFFNIMNGDTPDIKVSSEGAIIVFNKEELIVTFDFNNYQLISVKELNEIGKFYGELETVKGNILVFYDKNYNRKFEIPFHIEFNYTAYGYRTVLALDFECSN